MAALSLDKEFMQLWSKLTVVQKESLLGVIKSFANSEVRITLEQYNEEIEEAEAEFENGEYITHEEMVRRIKEW